MERGSYISNATNLSDIPSEINEDPSLIRFYGINEDDLNKTGVKAHEFAYLYRQFLIRSLYHLTEEKITKHRSGKILTVINY